MDRARIIAERVAHRLMTAQAKPSHPGVGADLAAVRAGLRELQEKLAQIETKVSSERTAPGSNETSAPTRAALQTERPVPLTHSPWLAGVNASGGFMPHASQEKFGVEEAVVSELVDFFEQEKICNLEPGGKPCDHCSMCCARGF